MLQQNSFHKMQLADRSQNFGDAPAQSVVVVASLMVTEDLEDIEAEQRSLFRLYSSICG